MRINKSELSKKIGQLKGIVPSRTTIEALKGVLCSDGYLIASDTNLTVKAKLEGMEEETEPFNASIVVLDGTIPFSCPIFFDSSLLLILIVLPPYHSK